MSKREKKIVRVECDVDGHLNDWVDYDTTEWTVGHFRQVSGGLELALGLPRYVETFVCDWNVTGTDGKAVKFPGQGASAAAWLSAYEKIGIELARWLASSAVHALNKRMNPPPKSFGGNQADGAEGRPPAAD
jgi:hypothetical protein